MKYFNLWIVFISIILFNSGGNFNKTWTLTGIDVLQMLQWGRQKLSSWSTAPLQLAPRPQCSFFPFNFSKTDQLSKCKSFSCNTFSVSRVYSFHFHLPRSGRNFSFVLMQESHASMGPWRMEAPKCVLMIVLWHTRDSTAAYRIGNWDRW